ncbi:g510 [Yersinia phage fHe-Yen9-04]|uniref:G510 protein n=2 Tax=Eneladusvirus Yen904 TaxID=2560849 RepID=A0A2C9CY56_9CAUD|nr:membrane protein [Yersinia phage fHe-Yen9-04]SOK58787.1 g510 [Yersinia phage fHe-Yen9-04]SOK59325.1 hypothetical protein [Yersinia phage fHe-Yen9-03]VUE36556.1 g510 [Yersinia phage fHe-Yen9-04]
MTLFGFIISSTLVNSLFLFDLYVTKYTQRSSLWGASLSLCIKQSGLCELIPFCTMIVLWSSGLFIGNNTSYVQFLFSSIFWIWFSFEFISTTIFYYVFKIDKIPKS